MDILEKELTSKIIKAFYNVYNTLGFGFLEKVYERAMVIELKKIIFSARDRSQLMFIMTKRMSVSILLIF
jgi:GxxExxY protein